jgi:hypothetical protein
MKCHVKDLTGAEADTLRRRARRMVRSGSLRQDDVYVAFGEIEAANTPGQWWISLRVKIDSPPEWNGSQ